MFAVNVEFCNGTYHGNAWGKHRNEGIVDYPPSNWRVIRALISVQKQLYGDTKDEVVYPILKKLATNPPKYHIDPNATEGCLKHYVPTNKRGKTLKNLIFDTFVSAKYCQIIWDNIRLIKDEKLILTELFENMYYLGRVESRCKITIIDDKKHKKPNCVPYGNDIDTTEITNNNMEAISILTPKASAFYAKEKINSVFVTVKSLYKNSLKMPPGSKQILYIRKKISTDTLINGPVITPIQQTHKNNINFIRYSIRNRKIPIINALDLCKSVRTACMSDYGFQNNNKTTYLFSGKDKNGKPLRGNKHAIFIPEYDIESFPAYITHITILSPKNMMDKKELHTLFHLNKIYGYKYHPEMPVLELEYDMSGVVNDNRRLPIFNNGKKYISATPFILPYFLKYRKNDNKPKITVKDLIEKEIKNRYPDIYPYLTKITVNDSLENTTIQGVILSDFHTNKTRGTYNPGKNPYKITLEFSKVVSGPIMLGYASHMGLGMFISCDDDAK